CVDEAGRARLAGPARQLDGIVDGRGSGHPRQVQHLIRTETEDVENLRIETLDGPPGSVCDEKIQRCAPALDACGDFRGERAIAIVAESRACGGDGGRKVPTLRDR